MPTMDTRGKRSRAYSAAVLSIAVALAIGCEKDETRPSGPSSGGSGGAAGGRWGRGGTSTGGTGGSGGSSRDAGGISSVIDAGGSADTASGGSDAAGPAVGVERFVGEWDYMSGGAQLSCPGAPPVTQTYQSSNFITFAAGAGVAPLFLVLTNCNLRFDVQGQSAVAQPGQSCAIPIGNRPATRRPDSYTFALEGNVLRESSSWTVTFTGSADPSCMLTSQGSLVRHP